MDYSGNDSTVYEPGKIFVGGLSWDTTSESMKAYFERYGEVSESAVMKDSNEQGAKPRGFGFITFADPRSVKKVMAANAQQKHILDGKVIDPKLATMKGESKPQKKVFVGGLSFDTDEEKLRKYFTDQGFEVEQVDIKTNEDKQKRGFAFVDFKSEESVEEVCKTRFFMIDSKKVEVKKAEPKKKKKDNKEMGGNPIPNSMYAFSGMSPYGYSGNERYSGQYSAGTGTGYTPYQYTNTYPQDYPTSYSQHTGSPAAAAAAMYQNYGNGYGSRGYTTPPQQMSSYGQDSSVYSQSRNGFPSAGGESYSTGVSGSASFSYDQGYTYGDQSGGGTPSYSTGRIPGSSTSGGVPNRGSGGSSYQQQSYGTH